MIRKTIRNAVASVGLVGLLGCGEGSISEVENHPQEPITVEQKIEEPYSIVDVPLLHSPTITPSISDINEKSYINEKRDIPSDIEICAVVEETKRDLLYDASLPKIVPVLTELENMIAILGNRDRNTFFTSGYNKLTPIGFEPSKNGGAFVKDYEVLGPFVFGLGDNPEVIRFNITLQGTQNSYAIEFGNPSYGGYTSSEKFQYRDQEGSIKITKIRYKPAGRNGKDVYEHLLAVDALASGQIQPAIQGAFYDASFCTERGVYEKRNVVDATLNIILTPFVRLWNTLYTK